MLAGVELLAYRRWTLTEARREALRLLAAPRKAGALVKCLFSPNPELRARAADVARRATDKEPRLLQGFADEFTGLLGEISPAEARTRWHLTLVAARSAHTSAQCQRLAPLLLRMMDESGNVLRCSAIEGLSELAIKHPPLRAAAEDAIYVALRTGTPAMQCRARHSLAKFALHERASARPQKEATRR